MCEVVLLTQVEKHPAKPVLQVQEWQLHCLVLLAAVLSQEIDWEEKHMAIVALEIAVVMEVLGLILVQVLWIVELGLAVDLELGIC